MIDANRKRVDQSKPISTMECYYAPVKGLATICQGKASEARLSLFRTAIEIEHVNPQQPVWAELIVDNHNVNQSSDVDEDVTEMGLHSFQ